LKGVIIAAPASGSGKTLLTLGLLRHLAQQGHPVVSAKVGPDYIDPAFHAAASGRPCRNLDAWAMRSGTLATSLTSLAGDAELAVCEGVMGLFDGARVAKDEISGSTADVARLTGWPVVLVVDARAQAASAAAVVRGFATHQPDVAIAAVIFNRIGGPGHEAVLRQACAETLPEIPVLGCLPRGQGMSLPERHLGLVQALEHPDLEAFMSGAASMVAKHIDTKALLELAKPVLTSPASIAGPTLPPLGGRIAVARDTAFAFAYDHVLEGWRAAGVEIELFSPLADEAPGAEADAIYLPGGYPELHAGRLAANGCFMQGLRDAAGRGAALFGECGGYMVLGRGLVGADGARHAMAGLLPLETSFASPRLHLGYRRATLAQSGGLGEAEAVFRGHEFHYAEVLSEIGAEPLFKIADAAGQDLGVGGLKAGRVAGSFIHLIDREIT
jgi:cobyrinic acid a,c-diamide synthase